MRESDAVEHDLRSAPAAIRSASRSVAATRTAMGVTRSTSGASCCQAEGSLPFDGTRPCQRRGCYRARMTTCAQCAFEYDLSLAPTVPRLAGEHAEQYARLLRGDAAALRRRPAPEVWSPLEYACHVRDVLLVQRERALAALRRDTPVAESMGREERVEDDGYRLQQPADVARQLGDAALLFGQVLARLTPDGWERTLVYGYPEPTERSLRWLAVHTLHELRHHLLDMRRGLDGRAGEREVHGTSV